MEGLSISAVKAPISSGSASRRPPSGSRSRGGGGGGGGGSGGAGRGGFGRSGSGHGRGAGGSVFAAAGRSVAVAPVASHKPPTPASRPRSAVTTVKRTLSLSAPVPASRPGEPVGSTRGTDTAREPLDGFVERERVGMKRAKYWSPEVENAYRLQLCASWRDLDEYVATVGVPEVYPESGFYSMLIVKHSGYFTYYRRDRECPDKFVPRVKLFSYKEGSVPPIADLGAYRRPPTK